MPASAACLASSSLVSETGLVVTTRSRFRIELLVTVALETGGRNRVTTGSAVEIASASVASLEMSRATGARS